ncbi:hypothetical protein BMS3Abin04_01446 [bacterium BMS3Abin04]|nr:hypothetical protein BMS3Abin04_01446 [bacterium BMS3Abin04]
MKIISIIYLTYLIFLNVLIAQVSGISASKLSAVNTATVPENTLEFEPSFLLGFSSKLWNEEGNLIHSFDGKNSLETTSQLNFRFTYGVINKLEAGVSIPGDASSLSVGLKYNFLNWDKNSFAFLAGFNTPLGNKIYTISNKTNSVDEFDNSLATGIVCSRSFTKNLSLDLNFESQFHIDNTTGIPDYFINADLGYYLNKIQLILGLYYMSISHVKNSKKLTINIGTTIERNDDFILVLNFPVDIYGINTKQFWGFAFAFTYPIK